MNSDKDSIVAPAAPPTFEEQLALHQNNLFNNIHGQLRNARLVIASTLLNLEQRRTLMMEAVYIASALENKDDSK